MVQTLSIRTKLLMAMLALVASVALMGVTAHDAHAQVTEIRKVQNKTPYNVYLWNRESGARLQIFAHQTESFNEWVPWAWNSRQFNQGKYIEIGFQEGLYACGGLGYCAMMAIWQEGHNRQPYPGDYIRRSYSGLYQPLGYTPNAPRMDGASATGGWRNLIITYSVRPPLMRARLEKVD